jgi:hypothetical protein
MSGVEEARAGVFRTGFFRQYLEHEIRGALRVDSIRFPEDLQVEVEVATGLPMPGERWLHVVAEARVQPSAREARLIVRQGVANATEVPIDRARIHIGRDIDVYRNGGMHRRNDLAFIEDNDVNRSVSREHAHIDHDRVSGEYRLFNDRWYARGGDCGTRIVRHGVSLEVHRDSRGAKLQPGDEIHLGRAVLEFLA